MARTQLETALHTLLDLLDEAVAANGDKNALSLRLDDGSTTSWSYRELDRRSRIAAWRLRALGLEAGDRLLTWSPSTPDLPATYFGAMRAGLIIVPLDLRMSPDAIEGIVRTSGARHLILGTGRDAPDPREAGLDRFPTTAVEALTADPDPSFPPDWEAQLAAWPAPAPSDLFELVFTSGTTGTPKGVMLAHENVIASIETFHRIVPRMEHRLVSLLPLSHLLEQAVGLFYALSVGADILYVRSRNPRVIFDALRDQRVTSMVVVPQVLDLFWSAIEREVAKRDRVQPAPRRRPASADGPATASLREHPQAAWRPFPALPVGRCVPAAGPSAGLGGPRRHRPPGLRGDRDGDRQQHPARRPRARHGRAAAGGRRDADRRRWGDPVQGPDRRPRILGEPDGYGRGFHHRRLVPDRRYRPSRRCGPADPVGPGQGHHRSAQWLQRLSRGHRERAAHRRHPRFRRARDPAGPHRGGRPRLGGGCAWGRRSDRTGGATCPHRRRGEGSERDARPQPAARQLETVARGRLPADAHAQDQARSGPGVDRGRHAPPRRLNPFQLATGNPTPTVSSACWIPGAESSVDPSGSHS